MGKTGELTGKMSSTKITERQYGQERKELAAKRQYLSRGDRRHPFVRLICDTLKPGEALRVQFDNEHDFARSVANISQCNRNFRQAAAERGIDNWKEFDYFSNKKALTINVLRNKPNNIKSEVSENGLAV